MPDRTAETPILFDLSRLLSRAERPFPTGIDRVELAYTRHLIATASARLAFAAMNAWGLFGLLSASGSVAFVEALAAAWRDGGAGPAALAAHNARRLRRELIFGGEAALHARLRRKGQAPVYLLVSHHHLDRPAMFARLKSRTGARVVCLVHDLIPITYPEYARPGQAERHVRRMTTVARYADAVIANSVATKDALASFLMRAGSTPKLVVAPLGVDDPPPRGTGGQAPPQGPYFVSIGTIEPKKNHLLLLNLWRDMAHENGFGIPQLLLIGRRGWENENVVDMIERCVALRGPVHEFNALPDTAVANLLRGARALLLPSFAEGYGLPLAEALAMGVPALCSDLPVLREVGGHVPDYLDPLDGPAWKAAILDYAQDNSPRRTAQLDRLSAWRPPQWRDHFAIVETLIEDIVQ